MRKILLSIQKFIIKFLTFLLKVVSQKHPAIWNPSKLLEDALPRQAIHKGSSLYSEDGLATTHNHDFVDDVRFKNAYLAGKATNSWKNAEIRWRAYVIAWAANKCASLEGDFVECGVNRGGSAMVAAMYVGFEKLTKTFYLLDTYKGIDERYASQGESLKKGSYSECYEDVKEAFRNYPNVKLIRGPVPDTLDQVEARKICYLSIDMNVKIPEIAAANYFWDKLVSGAVVVLDDYGFEGHMAQKKAFDEFAIEHGVQVLSLPTGQGLIFKP